MSICSRIQSSRTKWTQKCYPPYHQSHITLGHLLNFFPGPTALFVIDNVLVWIFFWSRTHPTPTVSPRDSGETNSPLATCRARAPIRLRGALHPPGHSEWSRQGFLSDPILKNKTCGISLHSGVGWEAVPFLLALSLWDNSELRTKPVLRKAVCLLNPAIPEASATTTLCG